MATLRSLNVGRPKDVPWRGRGGCFDDVASVQMCVEPGAGRAVVFAFDADPVLGGIGGMRTPICAAPRASCRR
jgi:hypothetical protein